MAVFSCVCLVSGGVLPVCFGMCAENVCVCARERERDKACALSPLPILSEFGRGSPGAPVAVMACS